MKSIKQALLKAGCRYGNQNVDGKMGK